MTLTGPATLAAPEAETAEDFEMIRTEVRRLCDRYGNAYWRDLEPDRYPHDFVAELTAQGWLGALIPQEYGGGGLSLAGASVILEEISASGGNPSAPSGTGIRGASTDRRSGPRVPCIPT